MWISVDPEFRERTLFYWMVIIGLFLSSLRNACPKWITIFSSDFLLSHFKKKKCDQSNTLNLFSLVYFTTHRILVLCSEFNSSYAVISASKIADVEFWFSFSRSWYFRAFFRSSQTKPGLTNQAQTFPMAIVLELIIIALLLAVLYLLKDVRHYTRSTVLKLARSDYLPVTVKDIKAKQRLNF